MKQNIRTGLFCALCGCFLVLAVMGHLQMKRSRVLHNPDAIVSKTWTINPDVEFRTGGRSEMYPLFTMLGPENKRISSSGTSITVKVPYDSRGYVLNLGVWAADKANPPLFKMFVNGTATGEYQIPSGKFSWGVPVCSYEFAVPGRLLLEDKENSFVFKNAANKHMKGRLYLVPYYSWRRVLPVALPLSGFLVIALAAFLKNKRIYKLMPFIIAFVLFSVYRYTFFTQNLTALGGYFFDDPLDFVDAVVGNNFSYDMSKHPLFYLVIRIMWWPLQLLSSNKLWVMASVFSLIGALNGLTAFVWFRRQCSNYKESVFLALMYSFSFSIWVYSSLYETYILSALTVHLFLLALGKRSPELTLRQYYPALLLVIAAALVNPPMLLLLGILAARIVTTRCEVVRKIKYAGIFSGIVLAGFAVGIVAIHLIYQPELELHFFNAFNQPVFKDPAKVANIQASLSNFTRPNFLHVIFSQTINSFCSIAFPFDHGRQIISQYLSSTTGIVSFVCLAGFWGMAIIGAFKERRFLVISALYGALLIVPYMLFFLFFNPVEMLLYSPPFFSLILVWLYRSNRRLFGRHTYVLLFCLSLLLMILNAIAIWSFH